MQEPRRCAYTFGSKTMNYVEPKTEDLARLAAEAMGWKTSVCFAYKQDESNVEDWTARYWLGPVNGNGDTPAFIPHKSHDHAQILLRFALKNDFMAQYCDAIFDLCCPYPTNDERNRYPELAEPEEKTRAFLRAVHESKK